MGSSNVRIRPWTIVLVVVAALFVIAGIVYATHTSSGIPSFFPGHVSKPTSHHHYTHAAAMFTLAVVSLVGAWMTTGTADDTESRSQPER